MTQQYDVAVVGLGAMGSAAICEIAGRGLRAIGFDANRPPHAFGSSHGETRIIREAYFEHPLYVPLVQRAYALWDALERRSGQPLLVRTGGLMVGRADGPLVAGALASARAHGLDHEMLAADDLRRDYPALRVSDAVVGVREPRAGVLFPERCIETHLTLAAAHGARLAFDEPVRQWSPEGDAVRVTTAAGSYSVGTLVLCAGAWMPAIAALTPEAGRGPASPALFTIERNLTHWFDAPADARPFGRDAFPIFLMEEDDGRVFYGFPELAEVGAGVKVSRHHQGEITTVDAVRREVSTEETREVRTWVDEHLPALSGGWRRATVCLYTNTPDGHFLIDRHPSGAPVWIVSPCSGHGFKFSNVIGELTADLVMGQRPRFDLAPFRLARF